MPVSDLAIIYALECSIDTKRQCIGPACPYFERRTNCVQAATEDAIKRLEEKHKADRKWQKAWEKLHGEV